MLMFKRRKLRLFIHSDISPFFFLFMFHYSDEISAMDCLIIYVINNCCKKKNTALIKIQLNLKFLGVEGEIVRHAPQRVTVTPACRSRATVS